jgi:hypothetical protein
MGKTANAIINATKIRTRTVLTGSPEYKMVDPSSANVPEIVRIEIEIAIKNKLNHSKYFISFFLKSINNSPGTSPVKPLEILNPIKNGPLGLIIKHKTSEMNPTAKPANGPKIMPLSIMGIEVMFNRNEGKPPSGI